MSTTDRQSTMTVTLAGTGLSPDALAAVARCGARVTVAPAASERVRRDRQVVEDAVARRAPVYGVTTGLGPRVTFGLPADQLAEFSVRTIRGRANAVGRPLPTEVVRAALVARCNEIAHGGSGVQPAVLELLVEMLNEHIHPVVPETGSIGLADLCQMAHVGLTVIGEGTAELDGEVLPADVALARRGMTPLTLGPKDGLALCSSNAVSAGSSALVHEDARRLVAAAQLTAALSLEGFRANTTPLDPRVQAARPVPESGACAAELRGLLADGLLAEPANARRLQDPVSFRCVAQVHAAFRAALRFLADGLDPELNGAPDNPLVLGDEDAILSTGNFHTAGLALALDTLALAICQTASLSAQRSDRLLAGTLTGLPDNLSPAPPGHSGYAPLMKSSQALVAELRHLATPLSTDAQVGAALVEDDSTNAPIAARRDAAMLDRLRYVLAIEALVAAQAVDLAAPGSVGNGPAALHRAVRARVPRLDEDRPCGVDVERVAAEVLGVDAIDVLLDEVGIPSPLGCRAARIGSARRPAAVDGQYGAGDVSGVGPEQEGDRAGDVLRPSGAVEQQPVGGTPTLVTGMRALRRRRSQHRRVDRARAHAVDEDALLRMVHGHRTGEADHSRLGRHVGGATRSTDEAVLRTHVDDPATPVCT
jgi:histidine ammonia-lyase